MRLKQYALLIPFLLFSQLATASLFCVNLIKDHNETVSKPRTEEIDRDHFTPKDFLREWKTSRRSYKNAHFVPKLSAQEQKLKIISAIKIEKEKMNLDALPSSKFSTANYSAESYLANLPLGQGIEFLIHGNPKTGKVIIEYLTHHHFVGNQNSFWESYMTQFVLDVKNNYWRRVQMIHWSPDMAKPIIANSYVKADGHHAPEGRRLDDATDKYFQLLYPSAGSEHVARISEMIKYHELRIMSGDGLQTGESIKDLKNASKKLQEEYYLAFQKELPIHFLERFREIEKEKLAQLKKDIELARHEYMLATHFRNVEK